MNVILYTTHCPKCEVLEKKLKQKNIDFIIETDIKEIISMGFLSAPILKVDEKVMDFSDANKWINLQ